MFIENFIHHKRSQKAVVIQAGDVDIETYEEDNSREHRKSTLWVDNKGRVVDVSFYAFFLY